MDCSEKESMEVLTLTSDDGTEGLTEPPLRSSVVKGDVTSFNGEAAEDSGNSSSGVTPEPCDDQNPSWDIEYRFNGSDDNRVIQLSEQEQMDAEVNVEFEYIINTFILPSLIYDPPSLETIISVFEEDNKENLEPLIPE